MKLFLSLVIIGALAVLAGCAVTTAGPDKAGQDTDALQAAATIFPLADITRQIGGEVVQVTTLLPPGASPHTFEPTPDQMRDLMAARVLISIGPGLDDWVTRLGEGGRSDRVDLVLLNAVPASMLIEEEEDHQDNHQHDHHGVNPHIWLDPVLVRDRIAPAIADALTQADPAHKDYFVSRLKDYQSALDELDKAARARTGSIANRRFVSVHAAWSYLARRYGLEQVAVVEAFPGQEPSAKWIAGVVDAARREKAAAVLAEPQLSTQTAAVIAGEFGGRVVILDPLGGPGLPGRDSYLNLMRYNLEAIAGGLR